MDNSLIIVIGLLFAISFELGAILKEIRIFRADYERHQ